MKHFLISLSVCVAFYAGSAPLEELLTEQERAYLNAVYANQGGANPLVPAQKERLNVNGLFEELDLPTLSVSTLKDLVAYLKHPQNSAKALISGGAGVASAVAWSFVFSGDLNVVYFLYPNKVGQGFIDTTSLAVPVAILMALPNMLTLNEGLGVVGMPTKHTLRTLQEASWVQKIGQTANFALAAQGSYNAFVVVGGVAWNAADKVVRDSVDGGVYFAAGSYILTTFLDTWGTGAEAVNRAYNAFQERLNQKTLGETLKKSAVQQVQTQLHLACEALEQMSDKEVLQLRAVLGSVQMRAKTEEEKQHAQLLTLITLLGLRGVEEGDLDWVPRAKPTSLKAAEWLGAGVGAAVLPWAIFASYFAYDQDNRFDSETLTYSLQPMTDPNAWAYAVTLGLYASFTGFSSGKELGGDLWSLWTGDRLNQYQASLGFSPQNLPGVRAITKTLSYGLSHLLMIPIAGLAKDQFYTTWNVYQFPRQRALLAAMLPTFAVAFHNSFDGHYQNAITTLAKWRGADPIGTARDELTQTVVGLSDWAKGLNSEQTPELMKVVDALEKQRKVSPAPSSETSFSSNDGSDGQEGSSEHVALSTDEGEPAKSAPVMPEAWADRGPSLTGDSLTQPLLGDHSPGDGGDGFFTDGDGNRYVQVNGLPHAPTRKHPWTRFKEWLIGKPVPASLKPLVQQIRSGKPLGQVPGDSMA